MHIYGFEIHRDGKATLTKMVDVGTGKGDVNPFTGNRSRWQIENVKTGPKASIIAECEKLNS